MSVEEPPDEKAMPEGPRDWAYPAFAVTPAERRRWRLCRAMAESLADGDADTLWFASRSIYRSDIPTE